MNKSSKNAAGTAAQPAAESKILGIELLRFASAIAVLIFHYQHFSYRGGAPVNFDAAKQPYYDVLGFFYKFGFYGVEVFWCISGFIFFWKYAEPIATRKLAGYKFSVLRISRLYPLHLATLVFVALMQAVYFSGTGVYFVYQNNGAWDFLLQLFMASNWTVRPESFNGPIWSISIEVLVYAAFFLSLRYVSRSVIFLLSVAVAAALIQILKISINPLFVCVMFFYLGCATAWVFNLTQRNKTRKNIAGALAAIVIVAALAALALFAIKPKYFLVLFTPTLIFIAVSYMPDTKLVSRLLVPAGNMTYASYLLHVPIQITVMTICQYLNWSFPFYSGISLIVFITGTLLLSHLTYARFEMPLQNMMRNRLIKSHAG